MTKAISIGECMVELRPVEDGHLRRGFAGDAYNTAVYLKRSAPDIDVAFLTATGDESLSDAMVGTWRSEGISDRLVFRIPGERPALYLIETNAKGDRKFHYWRSETPARLPSLPKTQPWYSQRKKFALPYSCWQTVDPRWAQRLIRTWISPFSSRLRITGILPM